MRPFRSKRLLSQSNPGKPRTDQGKGARLSSQRATVSTPGPAGPGLQTGIRVTSGPSGDSNVDASQTSFLCQDRPGYVCPRLPRFSRAQPSADGSGETPEHRGQRAAVKQGNPVNDNKGRVFSSDRPSKLMFPLLE